MSLYSIQAPANPSQPTLQEPGFYYFAYGSCMCPVDLKRSLGESTHAYVIGPATLPGYRLGFFRRSQLRNCGVLDIVPDATASVQGVLYYLPQRLSDRLDEREEGYCHETVKIHCQDRVYPKTRTYTVMEKLNEEIAPNDWYFNVVLRGALTCGLPEQYCWQLFHHMHELQKQEFSQPLLRSSLRGGCLLPAASQPDADHKKAKLQTTEVASRSPSLAVLSGVGGAL